MFLSGNPMSLTMDSVAKNLEKAEECIKSGQFPRARTILQRIPVARIPRKYWDKAANLSRRCGLLNRSLLFLNPLFDSGSMYCGQANSEETANYAFSLFRTGASAEAETLIDGVLDENCPKALFYKALIQFSRWDYNSAKPVLQRYIQCEDVADYEKLIGISNLIACHIFLKEFDEAESQLDFIESQIQGDGFRLLKNLCSEQHAEILIKKGRFQEALDLIHRITGMSVESGDILKSWLGKWETVANASLAKPARCREIIEGAVIPAEKAGRWEILRDLHFHMVALLDDSIILDRLFLGTPYPGFRARLSELGCRLPEHAAIPFGGDPIHSSPIVNIAELTMENGTDQLIEGLREGEWVLIKTLTKDLYRPPKLGDLFAALYPNESFSPISSSNRVHQRIFRFNQKMEELDLGFFIEAEKNYYRLHCRKPYQLVLTEDARHKEGSSDPNLKKIETWLENDIFSSHDAQKVLKMTERSCQRWLKSQIEAGYIEKTGSGRKTRYKIAS